METLTVTLRHKLPDTVNDWGFGGSIKKECIVLSNGDTWVWGTACYRHLPSVKYIQMKKDDMAFTGGCVNDYEVKRTGKAETMIAKYYAKQGLTVTF